MASRRSGSCFGSFINFFLFLLFAGVALYASYGQYRDYLQPNLRETLDQYALKDYSSDETKSAETETSPDKNETQENDSEPEESADTEPNNVETEQVSQATRRRGRGRVVTPLERERDELLVGFLDVGQGDAIFLQFPDNTSMLIDTGEGDYERFERRINAAGSIILPFLQDNGIQRLDYFISTHPHSDHMGAAGKLLQDIQVGKAIISGKENTTQSYEYMLQAIEKRTTQLETPRSAGGSLSTGDKLPTGDVDVVLRRTAPNDESINNASLTFQVEYDRVGFLLTGDTEREGEKELLQRWGNQLNSTVLKVGHHGSRSSSIQEFLQAVRPNHAVFMVGNYNEYGHPNDEVLSRFKEIGSKIHRTDEHGSIFMTTDGQTIEYLRHEQLSAVK